MVPPAGQKPIRIVFHMAAPLKPRVGGLDKRIETRSSALKLALPESQKNSFFHSRNPLPPPRGAAVVALVVQAARTKGLVWPGLLTKEPQSSCRVMAIAKHMTGKTKTKKLHSWTTKG